MNEKLLQMAREAGLIFGEPFGMEHLARFAELVLSDRDTEIRAILDHVGGCDAQSEWAKGWDAACDEIERRLDGEPEYKPLFARGKQEKV